MILHFLVTRMAVTFGKVNAFNPSQDEWPLYVERLEHVFIANGITDGAKKQAVFLSVIGASNYKLLSSLVAPVKPGEKEYSALVDKLTEHFTPAPLEIVDCIQGFENQESPSQPSCQNFAPTILQQHSATKVTLRCVATSSKLYGMRQSKATVRCVATKATVWSSHK